MYAIQAPTAVTTGATPSPSAYWKSPEFSYYDVH